MSKRSKSLPPAKLSMEETEKLFELLKGLSPREQATIRPVLERDLEFQRREKARIRHLKAIASTSEMKPIRERDRSNSTVCSESTESTRSTHSLNELLTPSTTPESQSGRVCCHCHCQLGLIFNAGTRCSQCRRLLCSNCRREGARSKWFCSECYLQRELRAASGEWVDNGGATEISSLLLEQMHRAAAEKRQQQNKQDVSKRNLPTAVSRQRYPTLPTTASPNILVAPSKAEAVVSMNAAISQQSWRGRGPWSRKNGFYFLLCLAAAIPSPSKSLNFERNSKTLATISNENLLHPTNVRPPLERQSENSLVDPFDNVVQEVPRGGQNQSSAIGHHREMLSSQNSNDSSLMSDSAMWRGKPQTVNRKTVGKSEPSSLSPPKHREAASDSRRSTIPGRPMVVGGVVPRDSTGNFGSIAKVDHLDVLVGNSCRSPPASMVTRSASQDTRLSRVSRMTPASSRDSLRSAVTHTTDDTPNDFRGKSSVALQAPYPVAFLGEIQLALSYDVITACLSVHIVQCRSLPHFGNHKPNPYVKVLLVPCQANLPVLRNKTNARKSDFNPIFDQTLQFPRITKSEVDEYRMQVSVWHKDLISQNSLIGELTITLRDYNWANPSPLWYRLEAKTVGCANKSISMEDDESQCSRSSDILSVGSGTSDRPVVIAGTRRPLLRSSSSSSSTSSRNSRGVRKAVFQRKTDGTTEEREHSARVGRMSMELEHDFSTTESERSTSKKPEIEDQAADWTIWI